LKNNYDINILLDKLSKLLSKTHNCYEVKRAIFTEKTWFYRYFIYHLIKNNSDLSDVVNAHFKDTELDWNFIKTLYVGNQKK